MGRWRRRRRGRRGCHGPTGRRRCGWHALLARRWLPRGRRRWHGPLGRRCLWQGWLPNVVGPHGGTASRHGPLRRACWLLLLLLMGILSEDRNGPLGRGSQMRLRRLRRLPMQLRPRQTCRWPLVGGGRGGRKLVARSHGQVGRWWLSPRLHHSHIGRWPTCLATWMTWRGRRREGWRHGHTGRLHGCWRREGRRHGHIGRMQGCWRSLRRKGHQRGRC